ncbi:hypothetical protein AVW09_02120 [Microbacterium sp. T32]|nr:hypothetical protein AVW09_02120 [Microbacterium sp. T32]
MKTPQEIATAILGKEPTLPEERATWQAIVDAIAEDREDRETYFATDADWTVEQHEVKGGLVTDLLVWPGGADALTREPVAVLALTDAGVDALVATLKPGA